MTIKINVTTFPRSGRTFLLKYLRTQLKNVHINAEHKRNNEFKDFNKNENYIGIIRNPFDSIVSIYAMTTWFSFKNTCTKKIKDGFDENFAINQTRDELKQYFDINIYNIINYYNEYYTFYLNNFDNILFLKFEDIINDVNGCLLKITKYFNIPFEHKYYDVIPLNDTKDFLISSKNNEWYEYAKKNIDHKKLENSKQIYDKILNMIEKTNKEHNNE